MAACEFFDRRWNSPGLLLGHSAGAVDLKGADLMSCLGQNQNSPIEAITSA